MGIETIRQYCLSFPGATEDIQWENDLLFRIGGKIFVGVSLSPASEGQFSFKCTPERFAELVERDGIVPAAYVARYHWVALEEWDAIPQRELKELLKNAYQLVHDKLPQKARVQLTKG